MTLFNIYFFVFIIACSIGMFSTFDPSDTLPNGAILYQEGYLRSTNNAFYATMQRDGNFVVYTSPDLSPVEF